MRLKIGYELVYTFIQPTPVIITLNAHYSRASDMETADHIVMSPSIPVSGYRDGYGNWCSRIFAPAGRVAMSTNCIIRDSGLPDPVFLNAPQIPVEQLPESTLVFLLSSRFCNSDQLRDLAWQLFATGPSGWSRVQAICDFVHQHIQFGYEHARPTRSASEAYQERQGVCRDYAHLAIAFCRALNFPARYCTGYLGDVGMPPPYAPGDFAAWMEVYIGGAWHIFDPRNNTPRIGRVLIARGRDAADVAITTTFGPNTLESFKVWCDELPAA
jgi:transglutaminase-like putative cysteine protease